MRTVQNGHVHTYVCVKGTVRVSCSCGAQIGRFLTVADADTAHATHVYYALLEKQVNGLRQHFDRLFGRE